MTPSHTNALPFRSATPVALAGWGLVIALYVAVAASTFGGFFSKWAFRDGSPSNSLVATMDGSADRPFIYRQLIPATTGLVVRSLPASVAAALTASSVNYPHISDAYAKAIDAKDPTKALAYRIAYYLVFLSWLSALVLLAVACHQVTGHLAAAAMAPLVFANIFPFIQTRGGYFYDPLEVAFLAASIVVASSRHKLWIVLLAPLAALNKESFFIWVPCLLPFYWTQGAKLKPLLSLGLAMALSAAVYWGLSSRFASSPGTSTTNQLVDNLAFFASLSSYLGVEYTYGLPFPRGVSVINLFGLSLLIGLAWSRLPVLWRWHLLLALMINVPLLLIYCWRDELRNLSFLFAGFTVMMSIAIARGLEATATARAQPARV